MKKALTMVLVTISLLSFPLVTHAAELGVPTNAVILAEDSEIAEQEVTTWYYRVNNGVLEKRLWSVTYGYWKTDWAPLV